MSLALLSLGLLAPQPARAQFMGMPGFGFGSGSGPLAPCDARGNLLPYSSADSQGYYWLNQGLESGTRIASGNYAIMEPYSSPPGSSTIAPRPLAGGTISVDTIYNWEAGETVAANNASPNSVSNSISFWYSVAYPTFSYMIGNVSYSVPVMGEIKGDVTGQIIGYFQLTAASGYGPGTYPATLPMLVRSNLSAYTDAHAPVLARPLVSASASASLPFFGESLSTGDPDLTAYHLMQCPVNAKGVVTVDLGNGRVTLDVSNGADYSLFGGVSADAMPTVSAGVKQDTRAVTDFPPGHEPTFRKEGYLTDASGNQLLDNYGFPIGKAVQNAPVGNALQVDIGVPAQNYTYDTVNPIGYAPAPDTSGSVYQVEYDGLVNGGPYYPNWADNGNDTYHWYSSHTGHSDGDTLPHIVGLGDYSIYPFPITYNAPYVMKMLYGDPTQDSVELHKQDADGSQIDHINFHYTFAKDGADATYNLYLHLHTLHEHWNLENTFTELPTNTPNAPATQLQCSPSPQTGGHPTTYIRNPLPRSLQYLANGSYVVVTIAGQLFEPEVNAFLAATGIGIQQVVPQPTTESFPDGPSDWQQAKNSVNLYNHPEMMNPPSLAQTDPKDDAAVQSGCTYELWERVYNKRYAWVGDKYGDNGYIGPDTWFTTEPWSRPIEHRYTLVNQVPTQPSP